MELKVRFFIENSFQLQSIRPRFEDYFTSIFVIADKLSGNYRGRLAQHQTHKCLLPQWIKSFPSTEIIREFSFNFFFCFLPSTSFFAENAHINSNEARWNATRIRKHVADLLMLFQVPTILWRFWEKAACFTPFWIECGDSQQQLFIAIRKWISLWMQLILKRIINAIFRCEINVRVINTSGAACLSAITA